MDNAEGWKTRRLLHQRALASKGMKPDLRFVQNTAVNADHFVKLKVSLKSLPVIHYTKINSDGKSAKAIGIVEKQAYTHPKVCLPHSHTQHRGSVSLTHMCMHMYVLGIGCHAPNFCPVTE